VLFVADEAVVLEGVVLEVVLVSAFFVGVFLSLLLEVFDFLASARESLR